MISSAKVRQAANAVGFLLLAAIFFERRDRRPLAFACQDAKVAVAGPNHNRGLTIPALQRDALVTRRLVNFLADRPALLVLFAEDFAFFEVHFAELLLTAEWIDPVIERPLFLVDFTHFGPGVIAVRGIFVFVFLIRPAIRSAAR